MVTKKRMEGFQKPLGNPANTRSVGLARITYVSDNTAECSCGGWAASHPRRKVLEDAIDRHLNKKHGGRGIRL